MRVPRNVFVFVLDSLRADVVTSPWRCSTPAHLWNPKNVGLTDRQIPNLALLRRQSTVFQSCWSSATCTTPSLATMLTGMIPPKHGVRRLIGQRLRPDVGVLADLLEPAGVVSLMASDFRNLILSSGLSRRAHLFSTRSPEIDLIQKAAAMNRRGRSVFGLIHLADIHSPYGLHKLSLRGPQSRWMQRNRPEERSEDGLAKVGRDVSEYLLGIRCFDRFRMKTLWDLMTQLSLDQNSLVIVTADHGEDIYLPDSNPGRAVFEHCGDLTEGATRVPFWIRPPGGVAKSQVVRSAVSHVDIFPTVLDFYELESPNSSEGRSLLRGEKAEKRVAVYSEFVDQNLDEWNSEPNRKGAREFFELMTQGRSAPRLRQVSLTRFPFKIVWDSRTGWSLFNLHRDPAQRKDIFLMRPTRVRSLQNLLIKLSQDQIPAFARNVPTRRGFKGRTLRTSHKPTTLPAKPSAILLRNLKYLGYL